MASPLPPSTAPEASSARYTMTISRMTVDKLGVKLYDRVSAVLAELVANAYDADARDVKIRARMGVFLAQKVNGEIHDEGYVIEVIDNGHGMTPEEVNRFYLRVGAERRLDPARGDRSRGLQRRVMGRKGVGKLAPFGVAERLEIISSGGELVEESGADLTILSGYRTAHLFLDRRRILKDTDFDYHPEPGPLDGTLRPSRGTTLRLMQFDRRRVPDIEDLARQLAQRFGVSSADWRVTLEDVPANDGTGSDGAGKVVTVGDFEVPIMPGTELRLESSRNVAGTVVENVVVNAEGEVLTDLKAGFECDGTFYPVRGWVAYAREPYKDDLMAGVRIYCRGKIAAQTSLFGQRAGFTGEYNVRSYLIGELQSDWLDEAEDLIQTDRRDILWSHELGQAFESWGQTLVRRIAKGARAPLQKRTWQLFSEVARIDEVVLEAFPGDAQAPIREKAKEFARLIGQTVRGDELEDAEHVAALVRVSLSLAPHVTLTEQLRDAAGAAVTPIQVVTAILQTAKVAELSSFGRIAEERLQVIQNLERLKDDQSTREDEFQALIDQAPWLIQPQWSPITANQTFATLKREFEKFFERKTGISISLSDFSAPTKRADFALTSHDGIVQIVEIKRPHHRLQNEEMDRLVRYKDLMDEFLAHPGHEQFREQFREVALTLVCDGLGLTGVHRSAFESFQRERKLDYVTWAAFLLRTRQAHEDFLGEADRQRRMES